AELYEGIPRYADHLQTFLIEHGILTHRVTLEEAVRSSTPAASGSAARTVATALSWTVQTVLGIFTILVLTFYLLVERESLLSGFVRLFPHESRPRVLATSQKISTKVSAWLGGQLFLAGTIGTTAALGLYLLGVPYFYVLALIAAVGEMIPVVGPLMSSVPAIL